MTQKLHCKYLVLYFANFFKEKRNVFFIFHKNCNTGNPPTPLGKMVYYVCMLYILVGNRVYYMYECVVPFRVRNRVAPP